MSPLSGTADAPGDETVEPRPHALDAVAASRGPAFAALAADLGLAVTLPDGSRRPIPVGALPVILDDADIDRRAALASHRASATATAARWRLAGGDRDAVLDALGPVERRLVEATWDGPQDLAVARVDFLGESPLWALEVNATIPAMQGYSDIAAEAWLRTFAPPGADVAALVAANGSNSAALLQALQALHAARRGGEAGRIALLCRRGDAQVTELQYLCERFRAAGIDAVVVHPDELARQGEWLTHAGRRLPLVYRHLFLSRLEATPSPALESALPSGGARGTLVLNRPAPHLEMKSTLAIVSEAVDSGRHADAIGLSPAERDAVAASVPWTRRLDAGARDLVERVAADPAGHVVKANWSYGGYDVFVGRAKATPEFLARAQARFPGVASWRDLVERAALDRRGGGFVVQRAVPRAESAQIVCTPAGATPARVITDYAAFASLGAAAPWGGVCRAASSDIVNLVGGGALVPLLRRSVAERALAR
jgi:hypothetical protein